MLKYHAFCIEIILHINTCGIGAKPIVERNVAGSIVAIKVAVMQVMKVIPTSRPLKYRSESNSLYP